MLKVVVGGSRFLADSAFVFAVLDYLHARYSIRRLAHGACAGADVIAGTWAIDRGVSVRPYPAEWSKYGRRAGPVRNGQMIRAEQPDLVIAFPGGSGTADLVRQAKIIGVPRLIEVGSAVDFRKTRE